MLLALAFVAAISGHIVDSTKSVLPGVTIEAKPFSGGAVQTTVTNRDGSYSLPLAPGTYDVSFALLNFATSIRRGVNVDRDTRIDATLYLSSSSEVVVTAKQTFRNLADVDEPTNDLLGIADAATEGVVTAKEIDRRPFQRAGEILETVPGVIVSQHSGEGKANQYYLRGFNLDHGTDIALTVAGAPLNMPTHAHGQGYADANFLIPELISGVQYKKGPYYAEEGDFASAGGVNINYVNLLEKPIALATGGSSSFGRALFAASPQIGEGFLLYAIEAGTNDGPWVQPDDFHKLNGVLRYTRGDQRGGFSITAMGYGAKWNSTDQIPSRAGISRFGSIDPTDGGMTSRYSLQSEWQRNSSTSLTQVSVYAIKYRLDLFSDFTYFLDDPVHGDQFEQFDDRIVTGFRASHRWIWKRSENVAGLQARSDDIRTIGLYHTEARERLSTTREDHLRETSGALYGQSTMQWTPWLRTIAGIREDAVASSSMFSPKLTMIFGPFHNAEIYANAGSGFHSNDARGFRDGVTPMVRTRGAELGLRTMPVPRIHLTASLWRLDMASELVFAGDAGTTEASHPSSRSGVELASTWNLRDALALDADYAYSRARFTSGERIPGAIEGVVSVGLNVLDVHRFSGELRYRYFGPRPLIEDNSVRSRASNLVNARIGYRVAPRARIDVDVFNVLNAKVSDVDYFYRSRLPNESVEGIDDVHFHPVEKRAVRLGVQTTF